MSNWPAGRQAATVDRREKGRIRLTKVTCGTDVSREPAAPLMIDLCGFALLFYVPNQRDYAEIVHEPLCICMDVNAPVTDEPIRSSIIEVHRSLSKVSIASLFPMPLPP